MEIKGWLYSQRAQVMPLGNCYSTGSRLIATGGVGIKAKRTL